MQAALERIDVMDDSTASPFTIQATIRNRRGLHARAAAKFVTLAEQFAAVIEVGTNEQTVSAQSIMGLMMLGAGKGTVIRLQASGTDAADALTALAALVEAGFHEQD